MPTATGNSKNPQWYVYIIRCGDNSLYTGISTDVKRRLIEHQGANNRGSKYLKGKGPLTLVLQHPARDRSQASRYEHAIKKLSKPYKEQLIREPGALEDILS